jgi:general secretion pathway protein G
LQALVKQPAGVDKWNGPYAKEETLKDAWGNDYKYTVPGQGKGFDLISLGADGKEGGEGENRDVSN